MMRVLKVEQSTMVIEINYDDVGILHYALYDCHHQLKTIPKPTTCDFRTIKLSGTN